MKGRYIYPHCGSMKLAVVCNVRNSLRRMGDASEVLKASVKVFEEGKLVFEKADFANINFGGYAPVKLEELSFDFDPKKNYLVAVDSVKGSDKDFNYFPQEHQITYETPKGQRAGLLYDHQPAFPRNGKYSPIVVLAPKVLVSEELNTYVIFANYREEGGDKQAEPLEVQIYDEAGKIVLKQRETLKFNAVHIFDVKQHLPADFKLDNKPRFLNLAARSGEAIYSIFTIIRNEKTGNIAIEHSLPPHYYVSGDKARIRDEALKA